VIPDAESHAIAWVQAYGPEISGSAIRPLLKFAVAQTDARRLEPARNFVRLIGSKDAGMHDDLLFRGRSTLPFSR
jgi:hypothetical protein